MTQTPSIAILKKHVQKYQVTDVQKQSEPFSYESVANGIINLCSQVTIMPYWVSF